MTHLPTGQPMSDERAAEIREHWAHRLGFTAQDIGELFDERDRLREALTSIGTRCEAFTGPSTCLDDPGRSPNGNYLTDRWCNGCIARAALDQAPAEEANET